MGVNNMLHSELIALNKGVHTEKDLFKLIAQDLKTKGFVNEGYLQGITEREDKFPTGLITPFLNVALPHSDTKYVEEPFIYVVRLVKPVTVHQMGDNQEMEVKDLFFLGIKDPSKQVGLLSTLMQLFQDEEFVEQYKALQTETEVYEVLKNKL